MQLQIGIVMLLIDNDMIRKLVIVNRFTDKVRSRVIYGFHRPHPWRSN
ncbi:hypothetical protein M2305_000012 [Gluconobacter cerinus]|nr:hypothetical protein [Gluconobacter cerinus]